MLTSLPLMRETTISSHRRLHHDLLEFTERSLHGLAIGLTAIDGLPTSRRAYHEQTFNLAEVLHTDRLRRRARRS